MSRVRTLALICVLTLVTATMGLFIINQKPNHPAGAPNPTPTTTAGVDANPTPSAASPTPNHTRPPLPNIDHPHVWASWALLDRRTGDITTGGKTGPSTTESMIKVAIGAQYLHQLEEAGRSPTAHERTLIMRMIEVSDNDAAQTLYRRGGADTMLRAVIAACHLHQTHTRPGWWSETTMTPTDAAKMGACIAEGTVASPPWADWLIDVMRDVRGPSRFGIIDARPIDRGRPLAIKNGYTVRGDGWHVNCLAVADWWSLEVMSRYPTSFGLVYGANLCESVAAALLADIETPAPRQGTGVPDVPLDAVQTVGDGRLP